MRDVVGPLLDRRGVDYAWATSGAEAGRMCEETHFEVALVDAGMRAPQAALAQLDLRGRRLRRSVVVFSADDDGAAAWRGWTRCRCRSRTRRRPWSTRCGTAARPALGSRVVLENASVEELRAALAEREEEAAARESQLARYAADLRETFKRERERAQELKRSYRATVRALANAVEARDAYTGRHAERVAAYGLAIAAAAGIDPVDSPEMEFGFLLHDVGKVAVPDAILFKPAALAPEEEAVMRTHPVVGWEILREIDFLGAAQARRPPSPRALGRRRLPRRPAAATTSRCWRASSPSPTRWTR